MIWRVLRNLPRFFLVCRHTYVLYCFHDSLWILVGRYVTKWCSQYFICIHTYAVCSTLSIYVCIFVLKFRYLCTIMVLSHGYILNWTSSPLLCISNCRVHFLTYMTGNLSNIRRNDNNIYVERTAAKYKPRQQVTWPTPTASQQRHRQSKTHTKDVPKNDATCWGPHLSLGNTGGPPEKLLMPNGVSDIGEWYGDFL
jgi:hypothetical protein